MVVKEISLPQNTAKIHCESGAFRDRPASSFDIENALFLPGDTPQIKFKSPVSGFENFLNFKKDGTGTMKALGTGGRIAYGDIKKK